MAFFFCYQITRLVGMAAFPFRDPYASDSLRLAAAAALGLRTNTNTTVVSKRQISAPNNASLLTSPYY